MSRITVQFRKIARVLLKNTYFKIFFAGKLLFSIIMAICFLSSVIGYSPKSHILQYPTQIFSSTGKILTDLYQDSQQQLSRIIEEEKELNKKLQAI